METHQHNNLIKFDIPEGVIEISSNAFCNYQTIKSITIPTTVTSIGKNCFSKCKKLTSLSIPSNVKSIGINSFDKCNNLKQLSLPLNEDNKYKFKVSYHDYLILNKFDINCENVEFIDADFIGAVKKKIPTNIPIISNFNTFGNTKEITIQNNIISLKNNYLSKNIKTITISSSVTYLCDNCFQDYVNLKSISILNTVQYIGKHLIDGCLELTKIIYDGNLNDIVVSYDDHLKYKSKGLIFNTIEYTNNDKIKYGNVIPSIVHSLHHSFYDRSNEMIHIPNHITSLDNKMFSSIVYRYSYYDSKLQTITIPTSIKTIPKYCFSECKLLTKVSLPSTLTTIKKKLLKCISLQSIIIPTSVIFIDDYAFKKCYSLTRVITSKTIKTFGKSCFECCYSLKDVDNVLE